MEQRHHNDTVFKQSPCSLRCFTDQYAVGYGIVIAFRLDIDTQTLIVLSRGNVDTASGGKLYGKCHHCCKKPYLCPDFQPVCFYKEGFVANKCNIDKSSGTVLTNMK